MFDPIKRNNHENRPLSANGGAYAMAEKRKHSPRIANMQDRVTDLIADANATLAEMPQHAPERPAMMTARMALIQAQRELTTL